MLVFLVGFMGSGKTTTGAKLARRLHYNFIDLDQLIEQKNNKSIPLIFKEEGEDFFRQTEKEVLNDAFSLNNTVISCGGGTPCFFDNLEQMKNTGLTVYLKLSPTSLFHRLAPGKSKRPLIADLEDLQVMEFIVAELERSEERRVGKECCR